jgi:pimeloyl-ACP methyl ester carboxylesterase
VLTSARPRRRLPNRAIAAVITALAVLALVAACTTTTSGHGSLSAPPTPITTTTPSPGSSTPTTPSPSPTGAANIDFSDCTSSFNLTAAGISASRASRLTIGCGRLAVPANYDDPGAGSISLTVVQVHYADQSDRIGSLIVNPGGPGASAISLAIGLAGSIDTSILEHYDLIGFDPRGVGLSDPITCVSDKDKDTIDDLNPNVLTPTGFAQAKQIATQVAQACTAKYGAALADFNTVETARDMDRVRAAVGDDKLNYLGFSYGTSLGSVYATLFPKNIRVAVLDGAVDPVASSLTTFGNQLKGFESAFDQFAADCITRTDCKVLGNPRQVVYQLVAKANASPIKSSAPDETRTAGSAIVLTGVLSALYDQSEWPILGQALIEAQHGDAKGLFVLADEYNERDSDGHFTNIQEANTAISCNDQAPGPTDAVIKATAAQWAKQYPMFGLWSAGSLFSCQAWQPVRHALPKINAAGSAPILVIGTVHDPATPYAAAGLLAKTLGPGVLLSWDGEGHTAYGGKSTCIDSKVNEYLIDGTVPAAGTMCPR